MVVLGCGSDKPEPRKVEQNSPFARDARKNNNKPRNPDSPLRNPANQAPRGREGEQLPDAEIETVLIEAAKFGAANNIFEQQNMLRRCANKTPASARCDGQLGLTMIEARNRRAEALYYLGEAAATDDPRADAALYSSIAEHLRKHGKLEQAVSAATFAVAREPSAANLYALGQTLSLMPERLFEAADRMAQARTLDDRIDWLHDEAVVRGQIPVREQAEAGLALFRQYVERAPSVAPEQLPTPVADLAQRMAELEFAAKSYPSQAEYDAKRVEQGQSPIAPTPPPPEPAAPPPPIEAAPLAPEPTPTPTSPQGPS